MFLGETSTGEGGLSIQMLRYTWWYMEKYQERFARLLMKFLMGC